MRDSQRAKVYAAEHTVEFILGNGGTIEHHGSTLAVPDERKFGDVASIKPYLDKILAFGPIAALPRAGVPVTVRERLGATEAHYEHNSATIAIPPYRVSGDRGRKGWALREAVVLHELAHHLCGERGHGPAFTAMMLYLFEHVISPEAAHLTRVAYYEEGVSVGPSPL